MRTGREAGNGSEPAAQRAVTRESMTSATSSTSITESDITELLKPRQGWLWKLGGGQETGSKYAATETQNQIHPASPCAIFLRAKADSTHRAN